MYSNITYKQIILRLLYENSVAKTTDQGQNEYVKNNAFKYIQSPSSGGPLQLSLMSSCEISHLY